MADQQSTKPARGTRDFLPDDIRRREYVVGVIRGVYERYGFEPLETPAFENIETLLGKYGEEGNQLIFKILKRGEEAKTGEADLALRYDLTVPLARVVAQYQNELPRFFKRYQIQPVWRADRPARGRFREFYQCDIDSVGSTSPVVEAETLAAVSEILRKLHFTDFAIRLNHRRVLMMLLDVAGVREPKQADHALVTLDKLDKIGVEGVAKDLEAQANPPDVVAKLLTSFGSRLEEPAAELKRLRDILRNTSGGIMGELDALANLEQIVGLAASTPAAGRIRIDPSLARGLSYYTGAIMEIAVEGIGSLGGGGRYDNLVGMFLGRNVPACGFSLGLERIIVVMTERDMFPGSIGEGLANILVTIWNDAARADALQLATDLRQAGLRVELYPQADKLVKQVRYADGRGIPLVAIVGDDEQASGVVTIKNMILGEQNTVPRVSVAEYVKRLSKSGVEP
jgi:histidyl-tRNA synthetase